MEDRITAAPKYFVQHCSDLCGHLARGGNTSGSQTCFKNGSCYDCIILKAFKRLKEYEDVGYTPEEIIGKLGRKDDE